MILRPYLQVARTFEWPLNHTGQPTIGLCGEQMDKFKYACMCIKAAIQGSIAFGCVGVHENSSHIKYGSTPTRRLIVHNIFGIMHARFGYMIVLATVYSSEMHWYLPDSIGLDSDRMKALFDRTLSALGEVRQVRQPVTSIMGF
jgi:hypothetical protein